MSDTAGTNALLCIDILFLPWRRLCWPLHLSCLPVACREAFPAAAVNVYILHAPFFKAILELIEASSGGSAAVCVAYVGRQALKVNYCAVGDTFAGRQIRCHCNIIGYSGAVPVLQEIGDCCRRLVGSHGLDVQHSVRMSCYHTPNDCARVLAGLAPHLLGISTQPLRLETLLPAAAQLEHVALIDMNSDNLSLLGNFHMLKELHVHMQHSVQLTVPLPQLHTLGLTVTGKSWSDGNLQCLLSQAPALRQLVLDRGMDSCGPWLAETRHPLGLNRWDMEALVGVQCQQLDLLTVVSSVIGEHFVSLLARMQCPLKLSIDIARWNLEGRPPLVTLLARLPNLVALTLKNLHGASNALRNEGTAFLPHVQRLELTHIPIDMNNPHLPLHSILSMCPALKHLSLRSSPSLPFLARAEVHARLWHAFKSCAKLVSLKIHES